MRRYSHVAAVLLSLPFLFSSEALSAEKDLVAHWDFDEGKGGVLRDTSGNANHGKIHGAKWAECGLGRQGGKGYALKFDGLDDYVDCGSGPSLNITGPITLEAWVFPETASPGEPGIVGKFYDSYALTYYKGGCWWYISKGGNSALAPVEIGSWQHIAGTFDGKTLKLYVNGRLKSSRVSKFKSIHPGKNFFIGCIVGNPTAQDPAYHATAHFNGMIDEVRVWTRTLPARELRTHYKNEASGYDIDTTWFDRLKLTPYYYFQEGKLVVDADFRGFLPLPDGSQIQVELARTGRKEPLQAHAVKSLPKSGNLEVEFDLSQLAKGSYVIKAAMKDKTRTRPVKTLAFSYPPPESTVVSPEQKVVPPLPPVPEQVSYDFELCGGGGFKITFKGEAYPVESSYSYPHGGANELLASPRPDTGGEKSWTVSATRIGDAEHRVHAHGKYYAIDRRIRLHPNHIAVKDTFTNRTAEDIGIVISNHLNTTERNFTDSYLGGLRGKGKRAALHNPTAFICTEDLGIGMIALDDVYVVQGKVYRDTSRAGISTDMFGLAPNASYTVEWAVYPVGSVDYFDFINAVRKELQLNGKTVQGGFTFMGRTSPPSSKTMDILRPKYVSMGYLTRRADHAGFPLEGVEFPDYPKEMALLKKTFAETRAKYPDVHLMFHIAHSLYATNKPDTIFPDSRAIDRDGKHVVFPEDYEKYFSKEARDAGWRWYIFYPTLDNTFGQAMLKSVDVMMDEIGVTGVWADGLMALFGANFTYDRWDGHTVEIDPKTKTIKRKFASLHLLSQDAIIAYCKKIASKGGAVLCDSGPGTVTFARNAPVAAYPVESGYDEECRKTHLAPFPMALGSFSRARTHSAAYRDILTKLRWGVLYYDYFGGLQEKSLLTYMYPITIEQIHSGCVRGRAKLITTRSGTYGWPNSRKLHFAHFSDGRGILVPSNFLATVDSSGVRTEITLKDDESAILKQIPVTLDSPGPVNLVVSQYDDRAIEIMLNAGSPVRVTVRDGDFRISPGAAYLVKADSQRMITADPNGALAFSLELNGQLKLRIERGAAVR